jgi:hypothetical protein
MLFIRHPNTQRLLLCSSNNASLKLLLIDLGNNWDIIEDFLQTSTILEIIKQLHKPSGYAAHTLVGMKKKSVNPLHRDQQPLIVSWG